MGVGSVWHLLAWTPRGCKFEAIDFKIDFILFFHACDWPHPVITLVAGPSCGKKRGRATTGSMTSLYWMYFAVFDVNTSSKTRIRPKYTMIHSKYI
jgi:hypothetical protein